LSHDRILGAHNFVAVEHSKADEIIILMLAAELNETLGYSVEYISVDA
jgi:hypothetical protein